MASVVDVSLESSRVVAALAKALPISQIDFAEFSRDLLGNFRRLHEQHGPIAAIEDGGQQVVFLFSPEYNQQVLSDTGAVSCPILHDSGTSAVGTAASDERAACQ